MGNLALTRKKNPSMFRRLAIGTWRTSYDPSVYGSLTLRMEDALRYMDAFRAHTGRRLTVTHMMGRAVGAVLEKMPDANAILRGSHVYLRKEIAVFFQVVLEDPVTGEIDLSGMTLRQPHKKTLVEIVDECEARIAKVKAHKEKELEQSRGMLSSLPGFLVGPALRFTSWLGYDLNLRLPGVPRDAFGSVMITNIGSIGLEEAYAPLVPYSRVPILLAVGAIEDTVAVEHGAVVPAKRMKVCATFDHRIIDGAHAAVMAKTLRAWFERPFEHFDPIPA
jgi:pyruvate dehydrogenase E2 component (dihydrolipoamide acetyltransferase)